MSNELLRSKLRSIPSGEFFSNHSSPQQSCEVFWFKNKLVQSSEFRVQRKNTTNYESITHNQSGQSILEVVVAATVGILVVAALVFTTLFSLRDANFAKNSAQATKLAQEGIEMVRTGRDRDVAITGGFQASGQPISSWSNSILWSNQISTITDCTPICYFNVSSSPSSFGELSYIGTTLSSAESISQDFKRVVTLSDDSSTYSIQKTATVIVQWSDVTGVHESKLVTILRKL